jgi:hypothetical protein
MGIGLRSMALALVCVGAVLECPAVALGASAQRGIERVSPQVKGADIEMGSTSRAAVGGGAVAYTSFGRLVTGASRVFSNEFYSRRTDNGWVTVSMNPPFDPYPAFAAPEAFQGVSPDASVGLAKSWGAIEGGHPQAYNLWRFSAATGAFDLLSAPLGVDLSPETASGAAASAGSNFAGGSEDFSHIVFHSSRALNPEAVATGADKGDGAFLYKWFGGQLRLVTVLPDGQVTTGAVLGFGNPYSNTLLDPGQYAVSADGKRAFFSTPRTIVDSSREVYVQKDESGGPVSTQVSESERTDCANDPTCGGDGEPNLTPDVDAPKAALFQLAAADSDGPAYFASPQKLTDESTATNSGGLGDTVSEDNCTFVRCALYRWDPKAAVGERLTDLTADAPNGGGVVSVVGASDDTRRVYFVAAGVLAAGGEDNQPNLYLWQEGQGIHHVATLDSSVDLTVSGFMVDQGIWSRVPSPGDPAGNHRFGGGVRTSRDGRYLVFRSMARLTDYDTGGEYQLYRYEANTNSLVCISCNPRTSASDGTAFLKREVGDLKRPFLSPVTRPPWVSRNVADDGDVVFDSAEALVPEDTNGKIDVYEWSNGLVRLVSSGNDHEDSAFLDASESGKDVFFTTRAKLVGSDTDNLVDLYDARVGGGFPEPVSAPECQEDACQGGQSSPPVLRRPVTPSGDDGNAKPGKKAKAHKVRCKKGFAKKRVRGQTRCVKKKKVKRSARQPGHGARGSAR